MTCGPHGCDRPSPSPARTAESPRTRAPAAAAQLSPRSLFRAAVQLSPRSLFRGGELEALALAADESARNVLLARVQNAAVASAREVLAARDANAAKRKDLVKLLGGRNVSEAVARDAQVEAEEKAARESAARARDAQAKAEEIAARECDAAARDARVKTEVMAARDAKQKEAEEKAARDARAKAAEESAARDAQAKAAAAVVVAGAAAEAAASTYAARAASAPPAAAPSGASSATARAKLQTTAAAARPAATPSASQLPTLGFKATDHGVELILPLIRSGSKTIELRRAGARLSDGSFMDRLPVGARFVGVPLSSRLTYWCVLEVTGDIEHYASHGAAWADHGDSALPLSLTKGTVKSAAEAQRFYERSFYNGQVLRSTPVLAIPIRVVAWHAS